MIVFDWTWFLVALIAFLSISLGVATLLHLQGSADAARPIRLLQRTLGAVLLLSAVSLFGVAVILGLFTAAIRGNETVRSPDGNYAARLQFDSWIDTSGSTVYLYSKHGFRRQTIFSTAESDQPKMLWIDSEHITIRHFTVSDEIFCSDAGAVKVHCSEIKTDSVYTSTGSSSNTGDPNARR